MSQCKCVRPARESRKERIARQRKNSRAYFERRADALVRAAVTIAIQRYDLSSDTGYNLEDPEEVDAMVLDLQGALRGEGTCSDGPCAEWKAIVGVKP